MNSKLITCIYNGLNQTKICGRLNRDRPYMYSLKAIAECQNPIVCYTSPTELSDLSSNFTNKNISFIAKDLYSLYFHNKVDSIRDMNNDLYRNAPDWRDRCVEIMWGKFLFMLEAIDNSPDMKNIFWIDAGISHAGIIHSRFNSHYEDNLNFKHDLNKETYELTFKNDLIFTDKFVQNLINYTGNDKVLNIACKNPQHPLIDRAFGGSVIGGIFGGNVNLVKEYCKSVIEKFENFSEKNELYKEEQIMTLMLAQQEFPTKVFFFDTWYHPDWGNDRYNPSQVSFCDFFDEISK